MPEEIATLAGGCFWCTEAAFKLLRGVLEVVPGYAGGHVPHPTYEEVCTGTTGHREAVQVRFDPGVLPYADLLRYFFAVTVKRATSATGAPPLSRRIRSRHSRRPKLTTSRNAVRKAWKTW